MSIELLKYKRRVFRIISLDFYAWTDEKLGYVYKQYFNIDEFI